MPLHDFPVDVLYLLLKTLNCPRDLNSLVRASAPCFRVYMMSPEHLLSSVLKNAILPEALHHALAILHVPAVSSFEGSARKDLEAFLDKYFQGDSFEFPREKTAIFALGRLVSQVSYFIDDYSAKAIYALGHDDKIDKSIEYMEFQKAVSRSHPDHSERGIALEEIKDDLADQKWKLVSNLNTVGLKLNTEQTTISSLSRTEYTRFQRAFFRYELYLRVFPVDYDVGFEMDWFISCYSQYANFLSRMGKVGIGRTQLYLQLLHASYSKLC